MTTHPILFSTPMVQAILEGRKTMTRRIVKPQPSESGVSFMKNPPLDWEQIYKEPWTPWKWDTEEGETISKNCPYGQNGDILWVKETFYAYGVWVKNGISKTGKQKFKFNDLTGTDFKYKYVDTKPPRILKGRYDGIGWYKRPSIFMPLAASRIFLKINEIKIGRLQDITEEDAIKEGVEKYGPFGEYKGEKHPGGGEMRFRAYQKASRAFQGIWNEINGTESWNSNPWIWVISFERTEKPENF
jgi:hypothetical protein